MLKIEFYLQKPSEKQNNLEYITIGSPQKVLEGKLEGKCYACEVYVPKLGNKKHLIYSVNPIDAVCNALGFAKAQLQGLVFSGFIISEPETHKPWKLEKKDPQTLLQEKIETIKSNKDMSEEDKQKILNILKESFGGSDSPIKDQINKLV